MAAKVYALVRNDESGMVAISITIGRQFNGDAIDPGCIPNLGRGWQSVGCQFAAADIIWDGAPSSWRMPCPLHHTQGAPVCAAPCYFSIRKFF
ncbi:hypothetical protein V8J88_08270 [Massilia sp. W12]|uniref:hypothetical protein n=1 Tax=Massilia sp. W12 TaxID=3126507 RepID=UPI0030D56E1F